MPESLYPSPSISSFTTDSDSFELRPMKSLSILEQETEPNTPPKTDQKILLTCSPAKRKQAFFFVPHMNPQHRDIERERDTKKTKRKSLQLQGKAERETELNGGYFERVVHEILTVKIFIYKLRGR